MTFTAPKFIPLVKGLDYKGSQLHLNPGSRGRPEPILELRDAMIVAINSADYCWTRERRTDTDWGAVLNEYLSADKSPTAAEKRKLASSELTKLRTHDIPKVDKGQIEGLEGGVLIFAPRQSEAREHRAGTRCCLRKRCAGWRRVDLEAEQRPGEGQ